ncbi:protein CPR-5 isoform X2 [Andrographis paniculata]|uniref:protein CPR-5 isoform X2 n=1 Tax=Andrographis paniculata TaxID=175694 RepID=UPI0021E838F1|nr:protein CPR-5 isoform X2 [Andrographis paniculata]
MDAPLTPPEPPGSSPPSIRRRKFHLASDSASSASSSNCCCATSYSQKGIKISRNPRKIQVGPLKKGRKSIGGSDVDALALPLGMSIAAVVSQVLVRENAAGGRMSVDRVSEICSLAVRESLSNVFGDKFDNFVRNFEKSFRSTLLTLRLIENSSQNVGEQFHGNMGELLSLDKPQASSCHCQPTDVSEPHNDRKRTDLQQRDGYQENSFAGVRRVSPLDRVEDSACMDNSDSTPQGNITNSPSSPHKQMDENIRTNLTNQQLVLHDKQLDRQLSTSSSSGMNQSSMLTTIEKSVMEQTRSNDLKAFEIGLIMKKLQLKEKQLALSSHANVLERWKLSVGFSKSFFKAEKFKTQLQDSRQIELLRKCLDFLVAGLITMLLSIAYGTYVYSHRKLIEATEACSPYTESKSWWMPKSMATFNTGLQLVACQIQVWSRMLFGVLMIVAITFLLLQRSSASHQTMPVTFLLLLGIGCGYAGKFCIDTLGGSGCDWLMYWEALCLLHFFANTFSSALYFILNGPILVAERMEHMTRTTATMFPYWMRRTLFFTTLIVLPLLCGLMPFASPPEWFDHFSSRTSGFMESLDD